MLFATYPAQTHVIAAFLQLQKLQQLLYDLKHKRAHSDRDNIDTVTLKSQQNQHTKQINNPCIAAFPPHPNISCTESLVEKTKK